MKRLCRPVIPTSLPDRRVYGWLTAGTDRVGALITVLCNWIKAKAEAVCLFHDAGRPVEASALRYRNLHCPLRTTR